MSLDPSLQLSLPPVQAMIAVGKDCAVMRLICREAWSQALVPIVDQIWVPLIGSPDEA